MSVAALFAIGVVVTCLLTVACAILFWAAREDGREDDRAREGRAVDRSSSLA
jgi:hypothetical protein